MWINQLQGPGQHRPPIKTSIYLHGRFTVHSQTPYKRFHTDVRYVQGASAHSVNDGQCSSQKPRKSLSLNLKDADLSGWYHSVNVFSALVSFWEDTPRVNVHVLISLIYKLCTSHTCEQDICSRE